MWILCSDVVTIAETCSCKLSAKRIIGINTVSLSPKRQPRFLYYHHDLTAEALGPALNYVVLSGLLAAHFLPCLCIIFVFLPLYFHHTLSFGGDINYNEEKVMALIASELQRAYSENARPDEVSTSQYSVIYHLFLPQR